MFEEMRFFVIQEHRLKIVFVIIGFKKYLVEGTDKAFVVLPFAEQAAQTVDSLAVVVDHFVADVAAVVAELAIVLDMPGDSSYPGAHSLVVVRIHELIALAHQVHLDLAQTVAASSEDDDELLVEVADDGSVESAETVAVDGDGEAQMIQVD
ncbi:hypothetical protein GCK72_002288 [Caenorhabditis remanei]|uniref:Uncharacterized protein n=1 Tax=Caenorhabditis remanei TaxID=31234 RepID=A0A6A5HRZ3_CAERE|nr:hypothetical protein GCK72_002288 [Caenorhabditis remanei]KAF1770469.1 hypothetical protein GCK72_002288 [Caenorhabditis remanei]